MDIEAFVQSGDLFVMLFGVSYSTDASEAPAEGSLLGIDGDCVVVATGEFEKLDFLDGSGLSFGLFNVQSCLFGECYEVKWHFGEGAEVFPVGVVTQLTLFWQSEGVESAVYVRNNGELGIAGDFDEGWSGLGG